MIRGERKGLLLDSHDLCSGNAALRHAADHDEIQMLSR